VSFIPTDNRPLVSIVIPYYDGEEYIRDAIESVVGQSYRNWELIIVDDGSRVSPAAHLASFLSDSRMSLIRHEDNRGIAASRNMGIQAANGPLIAFLDQDDIWLTDKLAHQVAAFQEGSERLGMVCTGMYFTDSTGSVFAEFSGYGGMDHEAMVRRMFLNLVNSGSIMMVRKKSLAAIGYFNETYAAWDDLDFWMRMASKYRITYIQQPLVKKRMHQENTSHGNVADLLPDAIKAIHTACRLHPFLRKTEHTATANMLRRYGSDLLLSHEVAKGRECLRKAIATSGRCWRAYILFTMSLLGKRGADLLVQMGRVIRKVQSQSFSIDMKRRS